jgi:hypothetical protein
MKYKLRLNLEWDEIEADSEDEALEILAEEIASNNELVSNIFWEGIDVEVKP